MNRKLCFLGKKRCLLRYIVSALCLISVLYLMSIVISITSPKTGNGNDECQEAGKDVLQIRIKNLRDSMKQLLTIVHTLDISSILELPGEQNNLEQICEHYLKESRLQRPFFVNAWASSENCSPKQNSSTDDITIVTQLSLNRLFNLNEILKRWPGPASVTVGLKPTEFTVVEEIAKMFQTYEELLRPDVSIHLVAVIGSIWPTNFLREIALKACRTKYVFLNDVDILPSKTLYKNARILAADQLVMRSKTALVVPAFEFTKSMGKQAAVTEVSRFPDNKLELLKLWPPNKHNRTVDQFHRMESKFSHHATDYKKWRYSSHVYKIRYKSDYEPYIIAQRNQLPQYNNSLIGRCKDKMSYILHLYAIGFRFKVMPQDFLLHMTHPRNAEPLYKQCAHKLYFDFKLMLSEQYPLQVRVTNNRSTLEQRWSQYILGWTPLSKDFSPKWQHS